MHIQWGLSVVNAKAITHLSPSKGQTVSFALERWNPQLILRRHFFLTGREPANKQTHLCTHGGYRFATVRRGRWRKLQRRQKEQKKAVSTISTYQIYFKTVIAYYSPNSAIIISLKSPISEGQSLLTRYIHLLVSWICANSGRQSYLSTDVCT